MTRDVKGKKHGRMAREQATGGGVLWTTDPELRITGASRAALGAVGLTVQEVVGRPVAEVFGAADHAVVEAHRRCLTGGGQTIAVRWRGGDLELRIEPLGDGVGA
jgi:PAS domain-containing protein